ncbi:MAG TPA: acetamidase/formamidase family protein [Roseiflexaceae bacterium]|nr:acetamidase/formamidase family protein [Roseiflexaceae bacterium]
MTLHVIEPERRTLHGHFSRDLEPILTIDSGDTVRFRTLDAGWRTGFDFEQHEAAQFEPRDKALDEGHCMCGPVAIRGAEPGMTLAVHIEDIRVGSYGLTFVGGWPHEVNERFDLLNKRMLIEWTLDADALTGRNQWGQTVALRPFMGVMGMPPDEPGMHPTAPPYTTGGNIDCKELVAGSTLYLPVAVPGGLFSTGDGHGVQGNGEVCVTAIECPMERVDLRFELLPDMRLTTPRAHTAEGWLTLGFHEDLNEATMIALEAMVALMGEQYGMDAQQALGMASLLVDLRITQIANGVKGVHAVLPHGAIR